MAAARRVSDQQILAAARACFLARGANVSLTTVATELGVSHVALLHRFGTKKKLLIASLGMQDAHASRLAERAPLDNVPIRDQMIAMAEALTSYFDWLISTLQVLRSAGIDPAPIFRINGVPSGIAGPRRFANWLRAAQKKKLLSTDFDADDVSMAFGGALQVIPQLRVAFGRKAIPPNPGYIANVVDALLRGIGTTKKTKKKTKTKTKAKKKGKRQ